MHRADAFRARMLAEGFSDIPTEWNPVGLSGLLITMMIVGGVVGTVYFIARPSIGRADAQAVR